MFSTHISCYSGGPRMSSLGCLLTYILLQASLLLCPHDVLLPMDVLPWTPSSKHLFCSAPRDILFPINVLLHASLLLCSHGWSPLLDALLTVDVFPWISSSKHPSCSAPMDALPSDIFLWMSSSPVDILPRMLSSKHPFCSVPTDIHLPNDILLWASSSHRGLPPALLLQGCPPALVSPSPR